MSARFKACFELKCRVELPALEVSYLCARTWRGLKMRRRLQIAGKKRRFSMRLPCLLRVSDLLLSAYTQRDLVWLLGFGDMWLSWRASSTYLWCWNRGTCLVNATCLACFASPHRSARFDPGMTPGYVQTKMGQVLQFTSEVN
jgi:hypothetical protein